MSKRPTYLSPDDSAELRKLYAAFRSLLERYGNTGEAIEVIGGRIELLELSVRESSEDEANAIKELGHRLKRLEELELLRQMGAGSSEKAKGLRADIQSEHSIEHLQEMLLTITKNLQKAELREARYGGNAPLDLLNQIDELKSARGRIEQELKELRKGR